MTDTADKKVTAAEQKLIEAEQMLAEAQNEVDAARAERDEALIERDGPRHRHQDQIDRMAYINRQAEMRAERAGKSAAILAKVGGELGDVDPRAPIDAAMARKTNRGVKRPTGKAEA